MLMGYILVSVVINVTENCNVCLDDLKLIKLCKICSILWDTRRDDFVNEKKTGTQASVASAGERAYNGSLRNFNEEWTSP
jgi:hypothetical protein